MLTSIALEDMYVNDATIPHQLIAPICLYLYRFEYGRFPVKTLFFWTGSSLTLKGLPDGYTRIWGQQWIPQPSQAFVTYLRLVPCPWRRAETDRVSTWIEGSRKKVPAFVFPELRSCLDSKSHQWRQVMEGLELQDPCCFTWKFERFHWILKGNTWRTLTWQPAWIWFTLLCLVKTFGNWWTCFQFKPCIGIARYDSYLFITCMSRL